MAPPKLLLVDDDPLVRDGLKDVLEAFEFEVVTADGVREALRCIAAEPFDALLTDLHMPGAGDGLTVVSAMHHCNPRAVAVLLSAHPDLAQAAAALIAQVDEVLTKPVSASAIARLLQQSLDRRTPSGPTPASVPASEAIAALLESETAAILDRCLDNDPRPESASAPSRPAGSAPRRNLHDPDRPPAREPRDRQTLEETLRDVIFCIRHPRPSGSPSQVSVAALRHGVRLRRQGTPPAALAEDSRILQSALLRVLEDHRQSFDAVSLRAALTAVAEELHFQLEQSLTAYANEFPIPVPGGRTRAKI